MRLLWFFVFLLALVCGTAFGDSACPRQFELREGKCVTSRPVHGQCPDDSKYNANLNLCVAEQ